jgi:sirohydrochlorin cobaltochelatase
MKQAVLILAHGSRDDTARAEYQRVHQALAARLPEVPLEFSVLEFPGDDLKSIAEGVHDCVAAGAERIVALPYFLFSAGHVREDLPGELRQAAAIAPGLRLAYQPPIGVDRRVIDVLAGRADEASSELPPVQDGPSAVLLVGAGTSDPDANADLFRAGRLLWERRQFELVEVAFVSLTEPRVAAAVRRCWTLGARRLIVVPYFLNTGVLSRRIAAGLETIRKELPGLEVALAAEMGLHPDLLDLLAERARCALAEGAADGLALPPCACAESGSAWACWVTRPT